MRTPQDFKSVFGHFTTCMKGLKHLTELAVIKIMINIAEINLWASRVDQNNAWSLDMTERISHWIGHKFSQSQTLSDNFVKKKLKII